MGLHTLTIDPGYVQDWGYWEAFRELIQNAMDAAEHPSEVTLRRSDQGTVRIANRTGQLPLRSLLLGCSTKRGDDSARGQFGEGYKLAMLALCRLGVRVTVENGSKTWTPRIEHCQEFGGPVLKVEVTERPNAHDGSGVSFVVEGVPEEVWSQVMGRILPDPETQRVLPDQAGNIYVGGLWVAKVEKFRHGYNFTPSEVRLDRDRRMVSSHDLSLVTSKLWSECPDFEAVASMLDDNAPDIQFLHHYATTESPVVQGVVGKFAAENPDRIPCHNRDQARRAEGAGLRPVMVSEVLHSLLVRTLGRQYIPAKGAPVDRLRSILTEIQYSISPDQRDEIEDIIVSMGGAKS